MNRLEEIVAAARRHPFYREAYADVKCFADAPVLEKEQLYARLDAVVGDADFRRGIYWSSSGGTGGGRPVAFPADAVENHLQRRLLAERMAAAGILSPDSVMLNLFPAEPLVRSLEVFTELAEHCGATSLAAPIRNDATAAAETFAQAAAIGERFRPDVVAGMPSQLIDFAQWCRRHGQRLKFDAALFGGEFLHARKAAILAEVFGVRRFNAVYGSAEMGIVGYAARVGLPPVYRVPRDILHVEIPDATPDGFGSLVVTNLVRWRHPLVRYDTRDIGRIVGRTQDEILLGLRARVNETFEFAGVRHEVAELLGVLDDFAAWQIVIDRDDSGDRLTFLLVGEGTEAGDAASNSKNATLDLLRSEFDPANGARIAARWVDAQQLLRPGVNHKTPLLVDRRSGGTSYVSCESPLRRNNE